MNSALKQRLVGAFVLVAVAVIFVPGFLREKQVEPVNTQTLIPDPPERETMTFESPTPPDDVEPAPAPETMFMPDDDAERQPVADSLEQAREQARDQEKSGSESDSGDSSAETTDESASGDSEGDSGENTTETDAELSEANAEQGAWVVQVASLGSAESARNLRDRLQDEGHRAYVREASTSSGTVSRVYIGPKIERAQAEEIKAAVDEALKVESLVLRFEP